MAMSGRIFLRAFKGLSFLVPRFSFLVSRSSYLLPMPVPLSDIEIQRELSALPGWTRRGQTLVKTWTFPAFPAGIDWVRRVADVAEAMNHHPDIDIRYTRVTATLSTHSSGGITVKDIELAKKMDSL
jgi:4a-hydroxytetrahydrobiopterin dehydratase